MKNKIKLKEITPEPFRCGLGACPAIFEAQDGNSYLIIGKKLSDEDIPEEVKRKIGEDEQVIVIPKGIISEL
jgi:hypothetical protein